MNKKIVILLSGYKRSGKDYSAGLLDFGLTEKACNTKIMSFASPMKEIIAQTFNISLSDLDKYKNDPDNYRIHIKDDSTRIFETTFRGILQRFGTEGMKPTFGDNVWGDLVVAKIQASDRDTFIIPDWRFNSEWSVMNANFNVITVRVNGADVNKDLHSSETGLDNFDFDFVLDNTEYDGRLQRQIKELIANVTK